MGLEKYDAVGYSRGSLIVAKLLTQDKRVKKAVLGGMGIDFTNPICPRRKQFSEAFAGNSTPETSGAVSYAKSIEADLQVLHLVQKHQPLNSLAELKMIKTRVLIISGKEDTDNGNPILLKKAIPKSKFALLEGNHNHTSKTASFSDTILQFLK